jgi:hypothetical protein
MMRNYYFYSVIAVVTIVIVLTFTALVGNNLHANAINSTVEYNSTSTICVDNKPCVTTICINNQQCHTITSNSTNTDNSTNSKKHTIVSSFPQENI